MANAKVSKGNGEGLTRSRRGSTMASTQLWLTPQLRAAVALVQAREECSMGDVIRWAILRLLKTEYPWALAQTGGEPAVERRETR